MTHNPVFGVSGHAWPALLALTQANRDAASALLLAMKAFGQFSELDVQPEEMHCWYTDAHDAADVATQAVHTLALLTTNASTVHATTCAAPGHAVAHSPSQAPDVSPPCTPRCRRSDADGAGTETIVTPVKHLPPHAHDFHGDLQGVASHMLVPPHMYLPAGSLVAEEVCSRLPRPPETRSISDNGGGDDDDSGTTDDGGDADGAMRGTHPSHVANQGNGPPPLDKDAAQSASLPKLEPDRHLSHVATQDISPPPQDGAAQSASLTKLEPGTHLSHATTQDPVRLGRCEVRALRRRQGRCTRLHKFLIRKRFRGIQALRHKPSTSVCFGCFARRPLLSLVTTQDFGPPPQDLDAAQSMSPKPELGAQLSLAALQDIAPPPLGCGSAQPDTCPPPTCDSDCSWSHGSPQVGSPPQAGGPPCPLDIGAAGLKAEVVCGGLPRPPEECDGPPSQVGTGVVKGDGSGNAMRVCSDDMLAERPIVPSGDTPPPPDLGLDQIRLLIIKGRATRKAKGDWPQRVQDLRDICGFAISRAHVFGDRSELSILSMTLAKLAKLEAPPTDVPKASRSVRRNVAVAHDAVGSFVGDDLIRTLLASGSPTRTTGCLCVLRGIIEGDPLVTRSSFLLELDADGFRNGKDADVEVVDLHLSHGATQDSDADQAASLPMLEPDSHLSHAATQDVSPPPQGAADQAASLPKLEPGTHLSQVTTQHFGPPPQDQDAAQNASLLEPDTHQGYGPPSQDGAAQSSSLHKLEPDPHLSQVTTQGVHPPPQPACSHGVDPVCAPSRSCVAVAAPGNRNCANEVDPVCLHFRSCTNEFGPDTLRTRSSGREEVPGLTRPSWARVVATGCARSCANGNVPDCGSCAIDPAVTADAPTIYDLAAHDEVLSFAAARSGVEGVGPGDVGKVPPDSAMGGPLDFGAPGTDTMDPRVAALLVDPEDVMAITRVFDLIQSKEAISTSAGDWQQRVCSLRQACRSIRHHAALFEDRLELEGLPANLRTLMLQLEHALSKIATQPRKRANPFLRSGAARKKYAVLRENVGGFIGNDIIQALVPEPSSTVVALVALKAATFTFMLEYADVNSDCN